MYFGLELGPFLGISIGIPLFVLIIAVILYFVHKRRQRFRPGLVDPILNVNATFGPVSREGVMVYPIPTANTTFVPDYESARDAAKTLRKTTPGDDLPPDYKRLEPRENPVAYQRRKRSRTWKPSNDDADVYRASAYHEKKRPVRDDVQLDQMMTQADMEDATLLAQLEPAMQDAPVPWSSNPMTKRQAQLFENALSAGRYYFG